MNKQTYSLQSPTGFKNLAICFSPEAIAWLSGNTKNKDEVGNVINEVSNFPLYSDLMSRMALTDSTAEDFRRPQAIGTGQAQISELKLVEQWGLGRKKVRNILDTMQRLGPDRDPKVEGCHPGILHRHRLHRHARLTSRA